MMRQLPHGGRHVSNQPRAAHVHRSVIVGVLQFLACFFGTFFIGMSWTRSLPAFADQPDTSTGLVQQNTAIPPAPRLDRPQAETARSEEQKPLPRVASPSLRSAFLEKSATFLIPPAPTTDHGEEQVKSGVNTGKIPAAIDVPSQPAEPSSAAAGNRAAPSLPVIEERPIPPAPGAETVDNWTIVISPNAPKQSQTPKTYAGIYASIPYRRAEYLANPSYRHDTTMEILFGQLRPTVINRTDNPVRVVNPRPAFTQPYPISKGELYSYWPLLQYGSALPLLSPIP